MPRRAATREDVRARLAQVAGWGTATRDDARVVAELHETRALDRVHAMDEAAFFDEFFQYLREIKVWALLDDLDPETRTGATYPFIQFVMVTLMRCVGGVQSMLATHDLLLTDEALMALVGFNAHQVQHGASQRGVSERTAPVEIRGALSYETVADNLVRIQLAKLAALFNGVVRALAVQGLFPKRIDAVLDATDDEATPTYTTDDGREVPRVTREKRPDVRANRHAQKVEVTVYNLLDRRHTHAATAITSNLKLSAWGRYLGDPTVAAAILDRLAMRALRLDIDGPSYRQHVGQERARQHGAAVPADDTTDP